jgi:carboxylesterase
MSTFSSDLIPSPPNNSIGVLLVHGLNGNRHDFKDLEKLLSSYGIVTENMLLPGHGTHVREMLSFGWPEWAQAVRDELKMLKERCTTVFMIGHSLGGALVLHTAAHETVAGVVALCPPLHLYPLLRQTVQITKYIMPYMPVLREDICDPVARRNYTPNAYKWTALAPVESMLDFLPILRAELSSITVPTMIMNATHDHVVPAHDGNEIFRLLGSQEKSLVTFHRSYHVIMKDYDREEVFSKIVEFIAKQVRN